MLGIPLYLWDTIWRFIPITCIDLLSLMVPAREIFGFLISLVAVTSDLYPCGRSLDPFYIFSAFYRFLSWKTSIGGSVFFCLFTFVPKDLPEEAPVLKTSMKRQLTDKRD